MTIKPHIRGIFCLVGCWVDLDMRQIIALLLIILLSSFGCYHLDENTTDEPVDEQHHLSGYWTVIDYCVYDNDCTGDCHSQEFLPIRYNGLFGLGIIDSIRDIEIDYYGNGSGYGNISFIGGEFYSRSEFVTIGSDWGSSTFGGNIIFSGDYFYNENMDTLQLIYSISGECIRRQIEVVYWPDQPYRTRITGEDSTECYNDYEIDDDNDTTGFIETWYPSYCAKLTFNKQY